MAVSGSHSTAHLDLLSAAVTLPYFFSLHLDAIGFHMGRRDDI